MTPPCQQPTGLTPSPWWKTRSGTLTLVQARKRQQPARPTCGRELWNVSSLPNVRRAHAPINGPAGTESEMNTCSAFLAAPGHGCTILPASWKHRSEEHTSEL